MRLSIKEKAGIVDVSRIFEGLHLSEPFVRNMADEEKKRNLSTEIIEEGERHFDVCGKCRAKLEELKSEPQKQNLLL